MQTKVDEIAPRIYRLATFIPQVAPPKGFTFCQFLIDADEPMLVHTGMKPLFPLIFDAVKRVIEPSRLKWIAYSHLEGDECGSMNEWLAAAPKAQAAHGALGCALWMNDLAARPPRALAEGERFDLGGAVVRYLDTPNVPHNVDAGLLFEEKTGTLFCSDLFAHLGDTPAITEDDVLEPAVEADRLFPFTPLTPTVGPTLRRIASLAPKTLAIMHGASYGGDGKAALEGLAGYYEGRFAAAAA